VKELKIGFLSHKRITTTEITCRLSFWQTM